MRANTSNHVDWRALLCDGIDGLLLRLQSFALQRTCKHSVVSQQLCVDCGLRMDDDYGTAFNYLQRGLRYSKDEIARLREKNSRKLFGVKKLQLVLDLDHTLLHTRACEKLTYEEMHLKNQTNEDIYNGSLYSLDYGYLMKLRPFVRTFLEEASTMFEMYICTAGSRLYMKEVAKFLDPEGKYFNSHFITREDINQRGQQENQKKSLDLVLGEKRGIIIVDDTKTAWKSRDIENLIVVRRYDYFKGDLSQSESMKTEESESDHGAVLVNVLEVLKRIHGLFFESWMTVGRGDVRCLLGRIRGEVLVGCVVFYSEVDYFSLVWAGALGAECSATLDSSVTHVISTRTGSKACLLAVRENKFLVHPRWIDDAYDFCHRPSEINYSLS